MLKLDFSPTGYVIMCLIWSLAGVIGAALAYKKGRNPFFWGILCIIAPIALFAIGGMRAPGEPLPPMFRNKQEADGAEQSATPPQDDRQKD